MTHTATSTDGNYSGITIAGVSVTVTDNDTTTPAVTLALSADSIGENGGVSTVTATVSPASAAAFTVTVAAAAVSPAVAADFRLSANRVLSFAEATTITGRRSRASTRCGRGGQDRDGLGHRVGDP